MLCRQFSVTVVDLTRRLLSIKKVVIHRTVDLSRHKAVLRPMGIGKVNKAGPKLSQESQTTPQKQG